MTLSGIVDTFSVAIFNPTIPTRAVAAASTTAQIVPGCGFWKSRRWLSTMPTQLGCLRLGDPASILIVGNELHCDKNPAFHRKRRPQHRQKLP